MAGRAGACRPSDPVDVVLRILREIVIDDVADRLDMEAARGHVGRDQDRQRLGAELLDHLETGLLRQIARDRACMKPVLLQSRFQPFPFAFGVHEDQNPFPRFGF